MTKSSPVILPYAIRAFWLLLAVSLSLSVLYLILVSQSIFNVAEREELNRAIAETGTQVAHLETIYLERTQQVTLARAMELGFVAAPRKSFASRVDLSPTLSYRPSAEQ